MVFLLTTRIGLCPVRGMGNHHGPYLWNHRQSLCTAFNATITDNITYGIWTVGGSAAEEVSFS